MITTMSVTLQHQFLTNELIMLFVLFIEINSELLSFHDLMKSHNLLPIKGRAY